MAKLALFTTAVWADELLLHNNECEKARGKLVMVEECDGSKSEWCVISDKEQCYADQVIDGKCSVGEYSEELGGIIGITPRVLCDGKEKGQ